MFNLLGDGVDYLYKILWLLIGLQMIVSGGVGFIFRILTKPLNIGFNNEKINEIDMHLSDLQLLRLYHGINVSTIEDAELAALAISRNKLKPQKIWLTFFYPAIGNSKHGKIEPSLILIIFIYCIFAGCGILKDTLNNSYDKLLISKNNEKIQISEIYVRNLITGENYNKQECKTIPQDSPPSLKTACNYLTTNDPDLRKELLAAIKNSNKNLTVNIFAMLIFFALGFLIFISYFTYKDVNNQFFEFKRTEKIHNQVNKYRMAFKSNQNS